VVQTTGFNVMANLKNLLERIDTIRANSVSDYEFEETWGRSLDVGTKKLMDRWDALLAQTRESVTVINN
jgi:hypothetical protein